MFDRSLHYRQRLQHFGLMFCTNYQYQLKDLKPFPRLFPYDPLVAERVHLARDREIGQRQVHAGTHDQLC